MVPTEIPFETPTGWTRVTYAKDQPEYLPLPVVRAPNGEIVTCWRLSRWERLRLLISGRFFLIVLTFNNPLQPMQLTVDAPTFTEPPDLQRVV